MDVKDLLVMVDEINEAFFCTGKYAFTENGIEKLYNLGNKCARIGCEYSFDGLNKEDVFLSIASGSDALRVFLIFLRGDETQEKSEIALHNFIGYAKSMLECAALVIR